MASRRYVMQCVRHAMAAGDWATAEPTLRDFIRRNARDGEALQLLGQILFRGGQLSAALAYLRRAAAASVGDAAVRLDLATALVDAREFQEAGEELSAATRLAWNSAATLTNLAALWRKLRRCDAAIECLQQAAALAPDDAATRGDLANTLVAAGQAEAALPHYQAALQLDPAQPQVWANLGAACAALQRPLDAARACRRAIALAPTHGEALLTLGNALAELGEPAGAAAAYRTALSSEPDAQRVRYNLSLVELAQGNWGRGWEGYRLRHVVDPTMPVVTGLPEWRGEPCDERTLLIRREQGVGTQLMFARYLPAAIDRAGQVIVECDERLRPLFARSFPRATIVASEALYELAAEPLPLNGRNYRRVWRWKIACPDWEAAVGDLPCVLQPDPAALPAPLALVRADAAHIARWRRRLATLPAGWNVGISWRGGRTIDAMQRRGTRLDQWTPLLDAPRMNFISLQHGDVANDFAQLTARGVAAPVRFAELDLRDDLEGLAGLISALDLVISVDNSVVHLAGALGAPTWGLLPRPADWRWLIDRDTSPWYSSLRLFRQPTIGDWNSVFAEVEQALGELVRRGLDQRHRRAA